MAVRKRGADRSMRRPMRSPSWPGVAEREDRRRFWLVIAAGRTSEAAALDVNVSMPVGSPWFREAGGMPPTHLAPSSRLPSARYLSFVEREKVALLRAQVRGVRPIARQLGRTLSTVSRELRRNAATRGGTMAYRATTAQWHVERAARRPRPARLAGNDALRRYVEDRLAGRIARSNGSEVPGPSVRWTKRRSVRRQHRRWGRAWSPERISARLFVDFPKARRCGSVPRRSTRRSTSRAGAACGASSAPACARSGRCASREPEPADGASPLSPPRS